MRVCALHFQVLLLSGLSCQVLSRWIPSRHKLCKISSERTRGEYCGCKPFNPLFVSVEWIEEDSEYFYIDDVAFRKPRPALTLGDASEAKLRLYPLSWPGGLIYYVIDESFEPSFRNEIIQAMYIIQNKVGKNHLEFWSASKLSGAICPKSYLQIARTVKKRCMAEVGRPRFREPIRKMWLNQDYCTAGIIQHELLHSLGLEHEQSRPDRDKHVKLNPRNMFTSTCFNFPIVYRTVEEDPSLSLPYDINSLMHYGSCFFSCNGAYTIVTKDGKEIKANRKAMTRLDILKVRAIYPANAKVPYSKVYCRGSYAMPLCSVAVLFLSVTFGVGMNLVQQLFKL